MLRRGAEDRAQSGLDIVDHGEFLLDQANHLRADRQAAGGTQQLEAAMEGVRYIAYVEGCHATYDNVANIDNSMSRPGTQHGQQPLRQPNFRRNSPHTDRRPLARTAHSDHRSSSDGGLWIEPFDSPSRVVIDR